VGQIISASCEACHLQRHVVIGGTRTAFREHSAWPCHCTNCVDLTSVNLQVVPYRCLRCGSEAVVKYGDPAISDVSGRTVASWDKDTLSSGLHLCPNCEKRTLRFGDGVLQRPLRMFD